MRFLVPVDGSTDCRAATHVAYQLAGALPDIELVALHVVNVRPPSGSILQDASGYMGFEPAVVSPEIYEAREVAGKALVDGFVALAKANGLKASGMVVPGAVTEELVKAANTCDLVIMGLRGESNDRFPGQGGAQTANAIPQIAVPALLVPRSITRIRAMAVGYDASPAAQRSLKSVAALKPLGVPVHLIYVGGEGSEPSSILAEAEAFLGDDVETVRHHVPMDQNVHHTLVKTTEGSNADMLVLGFSGKSTLKDAVFGSAREHLLTQDLGVALLIAH
ncbi:MAG: universal stress protein [Myxococcales bacterium]|nr:universal stress protein [Myxococcales bacterium]